ncbi:uncharacterized protein [Pocillopora verrucosa]|uniref:uncharacterized protein n=1 Tax=Pocillopora verrucosa TaxID=203993 RepID=UPI00333E2D7B
MFATFLLTSILITLTNGESRLTTSNYKAVNFAKEIRGRRLNGSVTKEIEVDSESSCRLQCVEETSCLSYNFGPGEDKKMFKCQLSNSDRFTGLNNFIEDPQVLYRGIKSPCRSNPCLDGALFCRPIYQQDDYQCVCKPGFTGHYCETVHVLDIHIRSEGNDDPGKAYRRSKAYIKVDGIDYSLQKRGFNVVVVDGETGVFLEARSFDTFADSSSGNHLRDFLNNLSGNKIVLVATQDSASKYMSPAIDALKRLGATDPLQVNFRDSFAFAGYAGVNKPQWITQERADRYLGPSEIFPQIPLPINQ